MTDFFNSMYDNDDAETPNNQRSDEHLRLALINRSQHSQAAQYGEELDVEQEDIGTDERIFDPFDPTKIRVETSNLTIDLLMVRIDKEELNLSPDFQRHGGIWRDDAQSRLIESLLIRIPLPAFYVDATDDDKWIVVDGLQRLTALDRFIRKKDLRLSGLEFLKPIEGKTYAELPRNFQRRINETQVIVYKIAQGTPPEVKFNIFKRINTGGLPLSSQEIRHALNQGKATDLLIELAGSEEFKRATDDSISGKRMADREFVLRFLAFMLNDYREYKPDFDEFLNRTMQRINNDLSDAEIEVLRQQFKRAMRAAHAIFDNDAFRKRYELNKPRSTINKPLFEAWSVNLSNLSDNQIMQLSRRRKPLQRRFRDLLNNHKAFESAVSQGTGDATKVRTRFSEIQRIIQETLSQE